VGDIIVTEPKLWEEPVRVEDVDLLGSFLRLRVTGVASGEHEDRLLYPKSRQIKVKRNGSWVDAEFPTNEDLRKEKQVVDLKEGMIVEARKRLWRVDSIDSKRKVATVVSISGRPARHELYLPVEDITPASFPPPEPDRVGTWKYQRMLLQALSFRLVHGTAVLTGLQRSRVIPMPFQLVPVIMALNLPRARLLLADDVGLGKTIEAGLILSELAARNRAHRILIVTPANLCEQWQGIMNRFFHFDFRIMSRRHRRLLERELLVGGNPWVRFSKLIVSMDYLKQEEVLSEALVERWDAVVIDEAHKVAKPHQSVAGPDPTMKRYRMAKKLAEKTDHLLLLSATPHNGYRDTFASLLQMLNPETISSSGSDVRINRSVAKNHICQRRRSDVEQWLRGTSPFPKRDVREIPIDLSREQEQVMERLGELSQHILSVSQADERENRLAQWTVIHFYKRALSSIYALERSIRNRLARAREQGDGMEPGQLGLSEDDIRISVLDADPGDRITEDEVDRRAPRLLFGSKPHFTKEERILESILEAIRLVTPRRDAKLRELLMRTLPECFSRHPRVIIFTRFKDTLEYLEREILRASRRFRALEGARVFTIHGNMSLPKRKDVFTEFKNSERAVLITTDCMSEGIDLQYASNTVIHYELPWNPNRLEQRNGRVDRFGQPEKKVFIRTFVVQNSIEAKILEVIIKKAEKIREDYGFAPPFFGDDLLILDTLKEFGVGAVVQTRLVDFEEQEPQVKYELESPYTADRLREIREDSFYGQTNIDLSQVNERMRESMEALGSAEEIESFVRSAIRLLGGGLEPAGRDGVFSCRLPPELEIDVENAVNGALLVTFDRELGVTDPTLHVLDLQSPVVLELVSHISERVFIRSSDWYGRTSAVGSNEAHAVTAVYHVRYRFTVATNPVTLVEKVCRLGLKVLGDTELDQSEVEIIWSSAPRPHNRTEEEIIEDLDSALHHRRLLPAMMMIGESVRRELVDERKHLKEQLARDGLSGGLEGLDEITLSSMDLVGVTLFYPTLDRRGGTE